jgi:hypothetical protein
MTALQAWQWIFKTLLAWGYSWLNAIEAIDAAYPGLRQAAVAEVARHVGPNAVTKTRVSPRYGVGYRSLL